MHLSLWKLRKEPDKENYEHVLEIKGMLFDSLEVVLEVLPSGFPQMHDIQYAIDLVQRSVLPKAVECKMNST